MVRMTNNEESSDNTESTSVPEGESAPAKGGKKSTTTARRTPARKSKASGGKSKAAAAWAPKVGELANVRVLIATDRMPAPKADAPKVDTATVTETLLSLASSGYVELSEPGRG